MKIDHRPADENSAREFVQWQYESPYDIYNCPPEKVEKAIQYNIDSENSVFAMFDENETLVGYCSYGSDAQVPGGDYSEEALDIGMMIKPELTGQGLGTAFAGKVIENGLNKYKPRVLRVTIAAFNKRAIRAWEKNGFQHFQTFNREGDGTEFVVMKKD